MRDINNTNSGNAFALKRRSCLPCTVRPSRQRSCNKRFGCLLCSIARIYDIWEKSLDPRKVCGSGPLLWTGWLCSSSTASPHRYMQMQIQYNNIISTYWKGTYLSFSHAHIQTHPNSYVLTHTQSYILGHTDIHTLIDTNTHTHTYILKHIH